MGGAYGGVCEHGQAARTPLAAFFNTPIRGIYPYSHTGRIVARLRMFAPTVPLSI